MDMDRAYADFVRIEKARRPAVENVGEQFLEASGTAPAAIPAFRPRRILRRMSATNPNRQMLRVP
ncbi:hypothetical protein [uncultured Roseobacter sp.]|uniref:hypothetical protein n=1 Tax=uncultured Roseobacter sp. TaxID=114847 RepID=UPI0026378084|nr:hypothetical protein [uncultured Roseobacter sp.]